MGNPIIVCFVGGTAGDIITQILDPSDLTLDRQRLKKPHLFKNNNEKDLFLKTTSFASIPSHDFAYHYDCNHEILGIVCRDFANAMWASQRFKKLHRPHVWKEMTAFCGADTEEAYAQAIMDFGNMVANYTNNVIYLDEILKGNAVDRLQTLGYQVPGLEKYKQWLTFNETSNNHNPRRSQYQN
jgi:hypothetical protein